MLLERGQRERERERIPFVVGERTQRERERERERIPFVVGERTEREIIPFVAGERTERERELETLFYKDCSLGSVKNLTTSPC